MQGRTTEMEMRMWKYSCERSLVEYMEAASLKDGKCITLK